MNNQKRSLFVDKNNKAAKILKHDVPLRLVKVLNIFCLTIPFACCWYGYYAGKIENTFSRRENLLMIGLFMVVYFLLPEFTVLFWFP